MKLLAGGKTLDTTLAKLIRKYDNIEFAVAWAGTGTKTYAALLDNQSKIHRAVIGTHFYQTHPDVLDAFTDHDNVRFILDSNELFHPKAYFFWDSERWELIIGSANMTAGGLMKNDELMLHISSNDVDDGIKNAFQDQLQVYWGKAYSVTDEDAERYRKLWHARRFELRRLAGIYGSNSSRTRQTATPPIRTTTMPMGWDKFLNKVRNDPHHSFDSRCRILGKIKDAFEHSPRFLDMDLSHRKLIAGLPTDLDPEWGYFGSMKRAHKYSAAVAGNHPYLSNALDRIPLIGAVNHEHYEVYVQEFCQAFPTGGDGIGVLSRLLAMKRPDFFLCLNSRNMKNLCADFGIARIATKGYDRYWDEVICRIQDSLWWNTPEPDSEPDRLVWQGRAAMLDAIFYED